MTSTQIYPIDTYSTSFLLFVRMLTNYLSYSECHPNTRYFVKIVISFPMTTLISQKMLY
jgi:hypothetical protein